MNITVLVTRPEILAQKTADVLKPKGFLPFILPLTETFILPLQDDPIGFNALVATSTAVFLHAPEERKQKWRQFPIFCVGETTAHYARNDGFNVIAVAPTALQLTEILKNENKHFLYLAGHYRRPIIESAMKAQKFDIIEVYDTKKCSINQEELIECPKHFDAVLFYSAQAAENAHIVSYLFDERTVAFCIAERIKEPLANYFKGKSIIASEPDENSIINALVTYFVTVFK